MSEIKHAEQIYSELEGSDSEENALLLYSISTFLRASSIDESFCPGEDWVKAVELTPYGKGIVDAILEKDPDQDTNTLYYIAFEKFFHKELLVDPDKIDPDIMLQLINGLIGNELRLPFAFRALLYKKFNEEIVTDQTNTLTPDLTKQLLNGTPTGIFQIGNIVSGPFGLVYSSENRIVQPTNILTLWHCSDPGCNAPHKMELLDSYETDLYQSRAIFSDQLHEDFFEENDWDVAFERLIFKGLNYHEKRLHVDVLPMICECFSHEELKVILTNALKSENNSQITDFVNEHISLGRNPETIVDSLDTFQILQTLMLLTNENVIHFIDKSILSNQIYIPPSEVRRANVVYKNHKSDSYSEVSSFGYRCVDLNDPINILCSLAYSAYDENDLLDELIWKLDAQGIEDLRIKLFHYLKDNGPYETIKQVVFISKKVTDYFSSYFNILPDYSYEKDTLANILVWKIGFRTPRYDTKYSIFRDRINELQRIAFEYSTHSNEESRAEIRAIGVNVFVSLEEWLEELVSYNAWLVSSDHYLDTNFSFNNTAARESVVNLFGENITITDISFTYSINGNNTIGCLLAYLAKLKNWLRGLEDLNKSTYERPEKDLPHHHDYPHAIFPFKHTQLWADSNQSILNHYTGLIEEVLRLLSMAKIAEIRNGIDHWRDKNSFPSSSEIINSTENMLKALDLSDTNRLVPKIYWMENYTVFSTGAEKATYVDYANNTFDLHYPSSTIFLKTTTLDTPILIAPVDFLYIPNTFMTFLIKEDSEHTNIWRNYPIRRVIERD